MQIYGKVHDIDKSEKVLSIVINGNLEYFHLTNKNMKDFKSYLSKKPYVFFVAKDEYEIHKNIKCRVIDYFVKILSPGIKKSTVYYDLHEIQNGVRKIINKPQNRMFLDLEFTLGGPKSYNVLEIVQYGFILEDANGNVIMQDSSLIRPMYANSLNKRTLEFLSRKQSDFDDACGYIEFYQLMERIIREYDPKILAWGKNDCLSLEKSFKLNHLTPLDIRNRYINLMQVIKNYYNYKQEMGLFNTYYEMSKKDTTEQIHDALEDAYFEREIFHMFKKDINTRRQNNEVVVTGDEEDIENNEIEIQDVNNDIENEK